MRVVFDVIDRSTRSIVKVVSTEVTDEIAFATALDIDLYMFVKGGATYELTPGDIGWLKENVGVEIDADNFDVDLRLPSKLDELPYEIHTGRELRLMLDRRKPLSVFSDAYTSAVDYRVFPEDVFEPYVASGLIVRREYVELRHRRPLPKPLKGVRFLLYALVGEDWRIDEYISMWNAAAVAGWNEDFERRQGRLLGYADWETDAFLRQFGHWWDGSKKMPPP
jgi:hypothetical protein